MNRGKSEIGAWRRFLAMSLATATMLALVWMIVSSAEATVAEDTCSELAGFGTNQTASVSGVWGEIEFDSDEPSLTLTVEEGWEVRVCVKAGSAQQGDGPEDQGWFGEGVYTLSHSSGKELSHFAYAVREVPTTTEPTEPTTTEGPTTTEPGGGTTTTLVEVNPICIDCNNATLADLMQLQGVNATLAQAIIDNRPYERLTDLVSKGVLTGPQLLLILVVNANTGAFASDDCLSFQVPSTTAPSTTAPGEVTTTTLAPPEETTQPGESTTAVPGGPNTPSPEDTLPFTGIGAEELPGVAGILAAAGVLALLLARGLREGLRPEEDSEQ